MSIILDIKMKHRNGFVSNSSSSSFIIDKYYLSQKQINQISNHKDCGEDYADTDYWTIEDMGNKLYGRTHMDNFAMDEYMQKIGIDMSNVDWDY